MASPQQFLDIANSQYGVRENPPGSNRNKFTAWYGMVGPWCAMFQSWCMAQVGMGNIRTAWCDTLIQNAKNGSWGTWIGQYDAIQPGDLAIFDWDGGFSDHVAAVNRVLPNGRWESIEGNWQDSVTRVTRGRANIRGFLRPKWSSSPSVLPTPPSNQATPSRIAGYQYWLCVWLASQKKPLIKVDGVYGSQTTAAARDFQRFANSMYRLNGSQKHIQVDGKIGPETAPILHWWATALSNPKPSRLPVPSGNPILRVGSPTSDQVRQLQTALNRVINTTLKIDGDYGTQTERAVIYYQTWRRLAVDGKYGPATARKLQGEPKLAN